MKDEIKEILDKLKENAIHNDKVVDKAKWNELLCKSKVEKAIEYIKENKNKTIAPFGDNEDTDYEICLFEEDIDILLNILQGGGKNEYIINKY